MMKNTSFFSITGKSLFEHYLDVCLNDQDHQNDGKDELGSRYFFVFVSLLEEMAENCSDILKDVSILNFLELSENQTCGILKSDFRAKLLYIIAAYSRASENYAIFREKFFSLSPHFELIFLVIDGDEGLFEHRFIEILEEIDFEVSYKDIRSFIFILLLTAIINDRQIFIDHIFNYENFQKEPIMFPLNMRCNDTSRYVALKLLESGEKIWKKEVPSNWITLKDFKKFLDSRVKSEVESFIELNCDFLQHHVYADDQTNQDYDSFVFFEDTSALEYIVNNESLKSLLSHPVISSYVDLKTKKFQRCYIFLFILVFTCLVVISSSILTLALPTAKHMLYCILVSLSFFVVLGFLKTFSLTTMSLQTMIFQKVANEFFKMFFINLFGYFGVKFFYFAYIQLLSQTKTSISFVDTIEEVENEGNKTEGMWVVNSSNPEFFNEILTDFEEYISDQSIMFSETLFLFLLVFLVVFKDIQSILSAPEDIATQTLKVKKLIETCRICSKTYKWLG